MIPTSKIRIARHIKTKRSFCRNCSAETLHNFKYELHQPRLFFLHGKYDLKKVTKRCIACNAKTVLKGKDLESEKKAYKVPERLH